MPKRTVADNGHRLSLGIAGIDGAEHVASGSFADVYRAQHTTLQRTVAVKILRTVVPELAARLAFERDCQIMASVSEHANLVNVYSGGLTGNGLPYLVSDWFAGGSLADQLSRRGPLRSEKALDIILCVTEALGVTHWAGVVHRDVKPSNILLTRDGQAALGDVGIARLEGRHQVASTRVPTGFQHTAPEVLEGADPTEVSDIYSLGSTMFEMLVGRAPYFSADDDSVWPLMKRALSEPFPDPVKAGVDRPLAQAITRATRRHPDERYGSVAELVQDLRKAGVASVMVQPGTPAELDPLAADGPFTVEAPAERPGGGVGSTRSTHVDAASSPVEMPARAETSPPVVETPPPPVEMAPAPFDTPPPPRRPAEHEPLTAKAQDNPPAPANDVADRGDGSQVSGDEKRSNGDLDDDWDLDVDLAAALARTDLGPPRGAGHRNPDPLTSPVPGAEARPGLYERLAALRGDASQPEPTLAPGPDGAFEPGRPGPDRGVPPVGFEPVDGLEPAPSGSGPEARNGHVDDELSGAELELHDLLSEEKRPSRDRTSSTNGSSTGSGSTARGILIGLGAVVVLGALAWILGLTDGFGGGSTATDGPAIVIAEAEAGPLQPGQPYAVAVVDSVATDATYRLLIDGEAVGDPAPTPPEYVAVSGRHDVQLEVNGNGSTSVSPPIVSYAAPPIEPGYRAHLATLDATSVTWPEVLAIYDVLVSQDHEPLEIVASDDIAGVSPGRWMVAVAGFGTNGIEAEAYCTAASLSMPDQCWAGFVEPNTGP